MFTHKGLNFTSSIYGVDLDKISQMSLDNFDDSFNFALNINNDSFDWFDNPYVYPNVYRLD